MTSTDRWALRLALALQRRTVARLPRATVALSTGMTVRAPASAAWHALTDPDVARRLTEDSPLLACTVPGTPAGAVGELSAAAAVMPDGSVQGVLQETVAIEPGRFFVTRSLTSATSLTSAVHVEPVGADACTVRATLDGELWAPPGIPTVEYAEAELTRSHWRLHRHLAGAADAGPEPPWPPAVQASRTAQANAGAALVAGPRVVAERRGSAVLRLPPPVAAELVHHAPSPLVERGDPRAWSFDVPAGVSDWSSAVRPLRATISRELFSGTQLLVDEVVDAGPWHLVTRGAGTHVAVGSVHVTAVPAGSRIDVVLRHEVLRKDAMGTRQLLTWRVAAYLDRLRRTAAGAPEPELARALVP